MKMTETITVQGDQQLMWEVFTDDTKSQTFGFMCTKEGAERVEHMLAGERGLKRPGEPPVYRDSTPMPFGKHKGVPMAEVPASYLHWLWNNEKEPMCEKKRGLDPVADYIRANLAALAKEHPDGIWE